MQDSSRRKRVQVVVACNGCRRKKIKCDGQRPTCTACRSKAGNCVYEADPDATPIIALRRKYDQLKLETDEKDRLLHDLRNSSEPESFRLLRRIRSDIDLPAVARSPITTLSPEVDLSGLQDGQGHRGENSTTMPRLPRLPHNNSQDSSVSALTNTYSTMSTEERNSLSPNSSSTQRVNITQQHEPLRQLPPLMQPAQPPSPEEIDGTRRSPFRSRSMPSSPHPFSTQLSSSNRTRTPTRPRILLSHNLESVKASRWGITYADDDDLFGILSSFFAWDHYSWRFFDEDLFLEDLVAGGSCFCSKVLLHSILAFGAKNYAFVEPRVAAVVEHFALVEAKKIFNMESDSDTPANIAAGLLIHATLSVNGADKAGHAFLAQAVHMAQNMGLFTERTISRVYSQRDPRSTRGMAILAWGLFAQQASVSIQMQDLPLLNGPPPIPIPEKDQLQDDRSWTPYPWPAPFRPALSSSVCRAKASLYIIVNEIMPLRKKYEARFLSMSYLQETLGLQGRLAEWYSTLAFPLPFLDNATPHLLMLHANYHQSIIELARPFARPNQVAIPHDDNARQQLNLPHQPTVSAYTASERQLRYLIHQYDQLYHAMPITIGFTAALLHVTFEIMPTLATSEEGSDTHFFFDLCSRLLMQMVEPFVVVHMVMRGIRQAATRMKVTFPRASQDMFEQLEKTSPRIPGVDSVRSFYPVDLSLVQSDLEGSRLENLLDQSGKLSLQ